MENIELVCHCTGYVISVADLERGGGAFNMVLKVLELQLGVLHCELEIAQSARDFPQRAKRS